ncbi:integrase core domain-containing protein [Streptomyces coelicoflavus]|uniref:integrase core domain-containing protein n=1 Tax=Streptomyces coelicoflavus TaxID=285562 RepID=UPI003AF3270F
MWPAAVATTASTGRNARTRARSSHWRAGYPGSGHGRFGGRPDGKGPAQQAPRRPADPTGTLRREFLDYVAPFASVAGAQEAINAWVHSYHHSRPHQSLDMAAPASCFRPFRADAAASLLTAEPTASAVLPQQPTTLASETAASPVQRPVSLGAIEFDREVPPCGHFALFHGGQDI